MRLRTRLVATAALAGAFSMAAPTAAAMACDTGGPTSWDQVLELLEDDPDLLTAARVDELVVAFPAVPTVSTRNGSWHTVTTWGDAGESEGGWLSGLSRGQVWPALTLFSSCGANRTVEPVGTVRLHVLVDGWWHAVDLVQDGQGRDPTGLDQLEGQLTDRLGVPRAHSDSNLAAMAGHGLRSAGLAVGGLSPLAGLGLVAWWARRRTRSRRGPGKGDAVS